MRRALTLAIRGAGLTTPNPMVGCVIVRGDTIVGEGWHRGRRWHAEHGKAHAEVEALREAGAAARGGTAYVSLEPCNHTGTTPPCTKALIEAGVTRVVYAMADPNPVAAGGAAHLRAAGIKAEQGPCTDEAVWLNRGWLSHMRRATPFVIAKYAASLDGAIATHTGESQWITGPAARERAHDLRQYCDAILVGAGTIIADNPSLTIRKPHTPIERPAHPLRIILDSTARTDPGSIAFCSETPGAALLATTRRASTNALKAFTDAGTELVILDTDEAGNVSIPALLSELGQRGIQSLMVEGGAAILGAFLTQGTIDEVWAFIAPTLIGGGQRAFAGNGVNTLAEALSLHDTAVEPLGRDFLVRGLTARGRAVLSHAIMEEPCSQAS